MNPVSHFSSPRWRKNALFLFMSLCFVTVCVGYGRPPQSLDLPTITPPCQAPTALLWDVTTNTVLLEKNARQPMHPSSMQKILTVYILLEKLRQGHIRLDHAVVVSPQAASREGSSLFLKPHESVSYEKLLQGIIVASGNDACTAVAESLAGTEALFAHLMNQKARQLGATSSFFVNASGLPHPQQRSTCWDLACIARRTLTDFPQEYRTYYGMQVLTHNNIQQFTRNRLLRKGVADGMKTGRTLAGKFGMVASAQRQGRRLLLVINGIETEARRYEEAARLLQWGFAAFQPVHLFRAGQVVCRIPVWPGKSVALVAAEDISVSLPQSARLALKMVARYKKPALCPVTKGQPLGTLIVSWGSNATMKHPLLAQEDVPCPSWIERLWYGVCSFFVTFPVDTKERPMKNHPR